MMAQEWHGGVSIGLVLRGTVQDIRIHCENNWRDFWKEKAQYGVIII